MMNRIALVFVSLLCGVAAQWSSAQTSTLVQNLDAPPVATQKPYHPADHQTVEITPPPFIWISAGRGAVYELQISRSETFPADDTRVFSGLKRAVHVPSEPLPPGKWFWRYGVETPDGVVYGRARPFTVGDAARPFPFPDFNQVVAKTPQQRPRLFFTGERLARVREAARVELKVPIAELVEACGRAIGEPLVAEPGYAPKDRAEYGPWAKNVMLTTRPPMDVMERCALAYLITGDRRLGLEAKRRLQHFFSWNPDGPTSWFSYTEPAMWVMMRGTRAYDWTHDLFTPEERAPIEANMKARALQFVRKLEGMPFESKPYESHAGRLPGFLGECAISFLHEWPEARGWLEYATLLYCTSYPAWGGDDGGWHEGPGYWNAYMGFALHFVTALRAAGIDLMPKPFFANTPFYTLYNAPPYNEHRPFGDGQERPPNSVGEVMYAFSTLAQNPHFRWHSLAVGYTPGRDLLSLANYDPSLQPQPPRDLPPARHFPATGLAAFHTALGDRDRDITFLFRSSPYGSVSHGHADQNAFVIEAFGRGLAIATGYYPYYGSPHHIGWTRATRGKNSVLFNDEGQELSSWDAKGAITAFHQGDGYDYVEGEAGAAYGKRLQQFRRQVLHLRPGIFLIHDSLAAHEPGSFQWLLHAYEKIQVDEKRRLLRIERAPAAMDVSLLLPKQITFTQTDRYQPEPELDKFDNTWHLTASTVGKESEARFLAVFTPHRIGEKPALKKAELLQAQDALGVVLTMRDGSEDRVIFRTTAEAGPVACGGLQSDARMFARGRARNGDLTRRFLLDGTQLSEKGKPVVLRK